MTTSDGALTPDLLLEHEQLVRSIAGRLLRDDSATDDAVQDTWLRALQSGPGPLRAVASWLGRVAQNRARDLRRSAMRRRLREQHAARGERIEATDVVCERLEVQREVVSAVLDLPEPYRSVVVRRYYHELTPTEIAAATGVKAATVRTQLVRAHQLLRARLDARYRDRAAWTALLLPLVEAKVALPLAVPAVALGALSAVLGAAVYVATRSDAPATAPPTSETRALASLPASPVPGGDSAAQPGDPSARTALEPPAPQDPAAQRATLELLEARAVLLDRTSQRDYADCCFSFESGLGGRANANRTRNDWDVLFARQLHTLTVTSDRGLVVDLGPLRLAALGSAPMEELAATVRSAATAAYLGGNHERGRAFSRVDPQVGHTSFVWTLDRDSDLASLFEVAEVVPGDHCTLEWYSTEDGRLARGSIASPAAPRSLSEVALALREVARAERDRQLRRFDLQQPRVFMQARVGAVGGNPCRIDLAGEEIRYFRRWSDQRLAMDHPATIREEALAYREGGTIPADKKFVVTAVRWFAIANLDTNGHGYFHLVLGDLELVEKQGGEIRGSWSGRVELQRGDEDRAYLEVSNSTIAEVVFEGEFAPRD